MIKRISKKKKLERKDILEMLAKFFRKDHNFIINRILADILTLQDNRKKTLCPRICSIVLVLTVFVVFILVFEGMQREVEK